MKHSEATRLSEEERTRLIGAIAQVIADDAIPSEARDAALTFIGWLARRMPQDQI